MSTTNKIKIILGFIITVVLLILSLRGIEWCEFFSAIKKISWVSIIGLIFINLIGVFLRARRWQLLLSCLKPIKFRDSFNFTNIGFFVNNILPARAGEIVRPFLLAQKLKISKVATFATIVNERIFDMVIVILFFIYCLHIIDMPSWLQKSGVIVSIMTLVLLLIFITISNKGKPCKKFNSLVLNKSPVFIKEKLTNFVSGINVFVKTKIVVGVIVHSLIIWIIYSLSFYLIIVCFPYSIDHINAAFVATIFVTFAIMLPSTPGYFGSYQYATILALGLYGITKTDALAISLISQLTIYFINIGFGLLSLFWEGINFSSIRTSLEINQRQEKKL